jgi:HEAT repeat protein
MSRKPGTVHSHAVVLALAAALLVAADATAAVSESIQQQIAALSEPDWRDRRDAAGSLGDSGSTDRSVVAALTGALTDSDSRVREAAAEALGRIGPKASKSIKALVARFDDSDPGVIAAAARAVGLMGSRASRASSDLGGLLNHSDDRVQVAAAEALGNIGTRAGRNAGQLGRQLDDDDAGVRAAAAEALGKLGRKASGYSAQLVQSLGDENASVRLAASASLVRIGEPATSNLIRALAKGDPVFLQAVVETLGALGPVAVPQLVKSLQASRETTLVRRYSALALARIGGDDERVVPGLSAALEDDNAEVRAAALEALGQIGVQAGAALQEVISLSANQREPVAVREQAIAAMARIAPRDRGVRDALVAAVADGNPRIYEAAVAALVSARSTDEGLVAGAADIPALERALANGSPAERIEAARKLGEMGPFAESAVAQLSQVLARRDNGNALRSAAAMSLGLIGPRAEAAVPDLIRALEDEDAAVRDAALVALDRIGPQTQTIPALLQEMHSGDLASQAAAAQRVRDFARARLETWQPLLAQSSTPVIRNWLARYDELYGVSTDAVGEIIARAEDDLPGYFDVLGGRAAIRESVQLDLIANPQAGRSDARDISVESLDSVDVESHPFDDMLKASDEPLARVRLAEFVPRDRFFAWFKNIAVLRDALQGSSEQILRFESALGTKSVDYALQERYFERLGLSERTVDQMHNMAAIQDLAVVTPDLFFVDGTDVTIIATLTSAAVTRSILDLLGLTTPADGEFATHELPNGDPVYWAVPGSTLILSSNAGEIRKVLELSQDDGENSLGRSDEFLYMQQQLGIEEATEAYLYLSDAFIRRLVGPETKIAQLRRMQARTEMEMVVAGALLFLLDGNRHVPSIEQLIRKGYLPGYLGDRDYTISDELIVDSEQYGTVATPAPLSKNPVEDVSEFERAAYSRFVANYSNFWRQFFDPIAIRLDRIDDTTSELTTFILPLPDSALFNQVRESLADKESGQRLRVPVMTPKPTMVFSVNLSDDLRLSLSEGLADMLVQYTAVNPEVFDSIGSGIHLAVQDSMPIVALGSGDIWGALDKDMLALGGFGELLPFLFSVLTQPSSVLIELEDPERVNEFLSAAVVLGDEGEGKLHKLRDREAWIYTLNIEGMIQVHLRLEITDGYLMVSNLPWSTQLEIDGTKDLLLNGANIQINLDETQKQLPALHTKIFADYRAAAVDGMGYLYPLLVTGVSKSVPDAIEKHLDIFGFGPVHPSAGQWLWQNSHVISSEFGSASYPVQPEYESGQRDFGLFPALSMLGVNMQLEDTGLRAKVRWRRRIE